MSVVKTNNKPVVVEKTGHPAAHRKIRCPICHQGYGVQSSTRHGVYKCDRCGSTFTDTQL